MAGLIVMPGNNPETARRRSMSEWTVSEIAAFMVELVAVQLSVCKIPIPSEEELETDEASIELRLAIERYIDRIRDEREF